MKAKTVVPWILITIVAALFCCIGYYRGSHRAKSIHLFEACVDGYDVSINGGGEDLVGPMEWNWADGTITRSLFPGRHTYGRVGSYRVQVQGMVREQGRTRTFTRTINVEVTGEPLNNKQIDAFLRPDLFPAEIQGRKVTVNGVVVAPVKRIQWNWGDGVVDSHHWFPATHEYEHEGDYLIEVQTVDEKGRVSTNQTRISVR